MAKKASTYYQMLGVKPEVTIGEIKKAYRQLVKSHHPDVQHSVCSDTQQHTQANEYMMRLNEAYETLRDKRKRAEYDSTIGANRVRVQSNTPLPADEAEVRELFLRQIFSPARQAITRVVARYKQQLTDLSLDIYDDELVSAFEEYVDELESVLRKSSNDLSSRPVPSTLGAAVQMMRYAIAQAADGLDELRRFCQNYDYDHLHMAQNLFREYTDLSRKALQLTKGPCAG